MQITAAVTRTAAGPFHIEELKLDDPREDEVLVRILGVGFCHTDLAARDQLVPVPLPVVLGHEGAGIVEEVGDGVTDLNRGDHVVLSFASCGACPNCDVHLPGHCDSFLPLNFGGVRADGTKALAANGRPVASHYFGQSSFASHALANRRNTVKVRNDAPIELLGPLGCGVQTGAGSVMQSLRCEAGSSLLVLGGGSVGLSAVLAAVVQGCRTIIVSEPVSERRKLAIELGATHTIDPMGTEDFVAHVRSIAPRGVDYIIDTSGKAKVISEAMAALDHRGALGVLAIPATPDDMVLPVDVLGVLGHGLQIKGISEGDVNPRTFIPRLIDLYLEGKFPFDKLISSYPLDEINQAVEDQLNGICVKPVLTP